MREGERYVLVILPSLSENVSHTRVSKSVGGRLLKFAKILKTVPEDFWVSKIVSYIVGQRGLS